MSIWYIGFRDGIGGHTICVIERAGNRQTVLSRLEPHHRHSAEFNWGYSGSGPAETALAILTDVNSRFCLNVPVNNLYQRFKNEFVAAWHQQQFEISADEIIAWACGRDADSVYPGIAGSDRER